MSSELKRKSYFRFSSGKTFLRKRLVSWNLNDTLGKKRVWPAQGTECAKALRQDTCCLCERNSQRVSVPRAQKGRSKVAQHWTPKAGRDHVARTQNSIRVFILKSYIQQKPLGKGFNSKTISLESSKYRHSNGSLRR